MDDFDEILWRGWVVRLDDNADTRVLMRLSFWDGTIVWICW